MKEFFKLEDFEVGALVACIVLTIIKPVWHTVIIWYLIFVMWHMGAYLIKQIKKQIKEGKEAARKGRGR